MNKDSWEIKTMGEIGFIITGNTPKTSISQNYDSKDINFVKPSDILNNEITFLDSSEAYISEFARDQARILPIGSVLVTCIGIIGKIAITNKEVAINQQINAIVPSNNILSEFLAYSLLNAKDTLNRIANAPVVPIINKTQFSALTISVPPITIQEQIVKELDTLSDIITKKKEQLAELDKLAQATFYDMFGDPVGNEKQWKTEKLDTLCTKITDGEHFRPETTSEGIPFLSAKDILQEGISFKNVLFVTQETAKKALRRCNPEKNDILIVSRGATVGRMNIVKTDQVFCLLGSVILLKFKPNELSSYFLLQTLRNPDVLNKIRGLSSSSAQQALYLKDLKLLSIPVPPLFLQNQFAEKIEAIEKQKALINQSITDTQLLFDYTMDKYFN